MVSIRAVQMDLLRELDRMCRTHGIPYILSRHTARAAVLTGDFPKRISVPTVAMHYQDAMRLMELMKDSNRQWENSGFNRNIPRTILRYSDKNSFRMRVDEIGYYSNSGLCVDIELIRNVPKRHLLNRFFVLIESGCVMCANFRNLSRGWKRILSVFVPLERAMLRLMYKGSAEATNRIRISRFPKKSLEFPRSFLQERQEIELCGDKFFVPAQIDRYMLMEYGENWHRDDVQKADEDFHLCVMDGGAPSEELKDSIRELYGNGPRISWIHWYMLRGRMRFLRRKIEGYWDILFCTKDRFDFSRQLIPRKDEICSLYQAGDMETVENILKPYLEAIDKHDRKNLVLCFDKDVFEIALHILRKQGKAQYAQKLQSKVHPKHLVTLKIKGYNHE